MSVIELQAVVAPRLNQVVDGDSNAALAVLAALALGIYHQRRTGQGQFVATSMIAGNAWAYSDDFCQYDGKPATPVCDGEYYGLNALHRMYPTADGWVCLVVVTDREWRDLVAAMGLEHLSDDERFATSDARAEHDDDLAALLAARFLDEPARDWEKRLSACDVGCVEAFMGGQPAFTSTDVALRETGLTVEVDHPMFGPMVRAAPPIVFSETSGRIAPPCVRGQHNTAILHELGYDDESITAFEKDGVVIRPG
jgi:crotonobetainyl-CoA:carnitine CoA-transferase CaiB-like acyl-CoA transferase